jgi:hypothetical protein
MPLLVSFSKKCIVVGTLPVLKSLVNMFRSLFGWVMTPAVCVFSFRNELVLSQCFWFCLEELIMSIS